MLVVLVLLLLCGVVGEAAPLSLVTNHQLVFVIGVQYKYVGWF